MSSVTNASEGSAAAPLFLKVVGGSLRAGRQLYLFEVTMSGHGQVVIKGSFLSYQIFNDLREAGLTQDILSFSNGSVRV